MNKHLHRIIFNPARGLRMVVQETATSAGKANGATNGARPAGFPQSGGVAYARLAQLAFAVLCLMGAPLQLVSTAHAQIVADPTAPRNQQPTVLNTANGLPLVNIQTPSAAGVSRNTYSQFDVNRPGAVLNNSRTDVQTQLGGWVQGNPWLATGSARVILNEVNSSNPSQLRGFVEVAGPRTEVIIANPAGVNIDGAGFINASRATITTGTASFTAGNLDGFVVQRGLVSVNGAGLDARGTDYASILARAVQVNGQILANELKVITGANQIDMAQTGMAPVTGAGTAPAFVLDASALGGMYAGKITLVGTEAGVGMRNGGVIGATAGDVVLQSNGWLSNSGSIQATGNTQINTGGAFTNSGTVYANGYTSVKAADAIANTGMIAAQGNANVESSGAGAQINSSQGAVIAAGLNPDGTLSTSGELLIAGNAAVSLNGQTIAGGNVAVSGAQLNLSGGNVNGKNLKLTAIAGNVDVTRASINTLGTLAVRAAQILRTDGASVWAQQLSLAARDLSNVAGEIVQTGTTDLSIQLASPTGTLDNTAGRIAVNSDNLALSANTLTNTDGKIEHAGAGTLAINAANLNGQRGGITGNGTLVIMAGSIDHRSAHTLAQKVTVAASNLNNRQGEIVQVGSEQASVLVTGVIDNSAGSIASNGTSIIGAQTIDNTQGRITSMQGVSVTAAAGLNNTDGAIVATQRLAIAAGDVNNTRGTLQASVGNAGLNVGNLNNSAGSVYAGGELSIVANDVANSGSLYATGNQNLNASRSVGNTGVIAAQGDTRITAASLSGTSGSLLGAGVQAAGLLATTGDLSVTTTQALTSNGQNLAAGNAAFVGGSVDLAGSQTAAANMSVIASNGNVNTANASVTTPGTLSITAKAQNGQTLINAQGTLSAGQLNLDVANLSNIAGQIIQTGAGSTAIALTSPTAMLDNTAGSIAVNSDNLTLSANTLTNTDGKIEHAGAGTLAINANSLNDQRGQITGNGALVITADSIDHRSATTSAQQVAFSADSLFNRSGSIQQIDAGLASVKIAHQLDNTGGEIASNGDLIISAAAIDNAQGRITSVRSASVASTGNLDNTDGLIAAAKNLSLAGQAVNNTGGTLQASQGNLTLEAESLGNGRGLLISGADLALNAIGNVQNGGTLYAGRNQSVVAGGVLNNTGAMAALGNTTINAGSVNSGAVSLLGAGINFDGSLSNAGDLSISTTQALVANGQNLAAGNASLVGTSVDLSGSQTSASNIAATATSGNIVTANAMVTTPGTLGINAKTENTQSLINRQGVLSAGQLNLDVANLSNVEGQIIQTGAGDTAIALTSPTGTLDNTAGRIAVNSGNLTLRAYTLTNTDGTIEHAGAGTLAINASSLNGQRGHISSNGALRLSAGSVDYRSAATLAQQVMMTTADLDNRQGEIIQTGAGPTSISAIGTLDNSAGRIETNGLAAVSAGILNNTQGRVTALQSASVMASTRLNNTGGTIAATHNLTLAGGNVDNTGGTLQASKGNASLSVGDLNNSAGSVYAGGNLTTTAASVTNSGSLYASGNQSLNASGLVSNTGAIAAQGDTTLGADSLSSTAFSLLGAGIEANGVFANSGNLTVTATHGLIASGQNLAADHAALRGASLKLTGSQTSAADIFLIASAGDVDTSAATLTTPGILAITANAQSGQNLVNRQGTLSAGQLNLKVANLSNVDGQIIQTGSEDTTVALTSPTGMLDNTAGRIAVNSSNLTLAANTLINTDGRIEHAGTGTLALDAITLSDLRGQITGSGSLSITAGALDHQSASTFARQLTIAASSLNNHQGELIQTGSGQTRITVSGATDNSAGTMASNGDIVLATQNLDNRGGTVQATKAAGLSVSVNASLDNSAAGKLAAGSDFSLLAGSLANSAGSITAGGVLAATVTHGFNNAQGLIAANRDVTLVAASLDNARGAIASVQGSATVNTAGISNNDSGKIQSALDLTLVNTGLSNRQAAGVAESGSILAGRHLTVQTHGNALDNGQGTLAANKLVSLQTGALNNDGGLIQAGGGLSINTGGATLSNANAAEHVTGAGGITSQGAMNLVTGDLNNANGFVGAAGALAARAGNVSNTAGGQIVGQSSVSVSSTGFDNRGGQVQALGNISVDAGTGSIDNRGGLMRSAEGVTLAAATVNNANTLGANQGIEGKNVAIAAFLIANNQGSIRADNNASLISSGRIDNTAGLISAGNTVLLQDLAATKTLAVANTSGTIIAGQNAVISAASLSGDGKVLSRGDLTIALVSDFNNSGEITANRNASIGTTASLSNSGKLQAGNSLTVNAQHIDNAATGEIIGAATQVNAANALTNRGLVDGQETQVNTATLNNIGTGRIYGDRLSMAAATVNNAAESGSAATIAARDRLDMGAQVINNNEDALIFSAGDLAMGGSLDATRRATGLAQAINNNASTIEALGNLSASASQINNLNSNFAYSIRLDSGTAVKEYVTSLGTFSGADVGWELSPETFQAAGHGGYLYATPTGKGRIVLASAPYGNRAFEPYYSGANAYTAPSFETVSSGDSSFTVPVPDSFFYAPDSTVWQVFSLAPPTGAAPGPRPTGTSWGSDDNPVLIPPTAAEIAAWETAAAPWLALQGKIDNLRASVDTSALSFDGFRSYTATVPVATITQSTPARILSGGAMTLHAASSLLNDQSQIVAGGVLSITGQAVENRARVVTVDAQRNGTAYAWRDYNEGCGNFFGCDYNYNAYGDSTYVQSVPLSVNLNIGNTRSFTAPASQGLASGEQLAAASSASTSANTSAAGAASATVLAAMPTPGNAGVGSATPIGDTAAPSAAGALGPNASGLAANAASAVPISVFAGVPIASATGAVGPSDSSLLANAGQASPIAIAVRPFVELATGIAGPSGSDLAANSGVPASITAATGVALAPAAGPQGAPAPAAPGTGTTAGAIVAATGHVQIVRIAAVNTTVPHTSLFGINPKPSATFLVETDPRFTDRRLWLGSDYLLAQLQLDPNVTQKRLGDGFYEQRLVKEQVAQLTGRRFLDGYSSDEQEYQALMDAGITYAKAHQLRPGIALTAEQMAQLSSDIVWLVEQEVVLADASAQKVLVPQVYVRVKDGDLAPSGALLAGSSVNLNLTGELANSGVIAGRSIVSLSADNVHNLGGRISGDAVSIAARQDLNNIGGTIEAGSALTASAGRDINIETTTTGAANRVSSNGSANAFSRTGIDRVAGLYVTSPGGALLASAGRDVNVIGAVIQSQGSAALQAGNNLNLGSVYTSSSAALVRDASNYLADSQSAQLGSQIASGGSLRLSAVQDINATAANVQAQGALMATAGRNVNLTAGQQTSSFGFGLTQSESGFLSSSQTTERRSSNQTHALASNLGAGTVALSSGQDITLKGSSIVSDKGTALVAGRNLAIEAATNTGESTSFYQKKESGLLGSGGIGFTIGKREQSTDQQGQSTSAAGSTIGAITGSVTLQAGNQYRQVGSDVLAPGGDIAIVAKKVDIIEARETSQSATEQKFRQSGLSLAITSPVISAVQTVQQMSQAAGNTGDARMQGLALASSALGARGAYNAVQAGQGSTLNGKDGQIATGGQNPDGTPASRDATAADKVGGINVAISIGSSKSQSNQQSQSDTARGSTVSAGGNVAIIATGGGQASDLTVQGSGITAGNSATLIADNQINLLASQSTASQTSGNSSSSGSVGMSIGTTGGLTFNASASRGQGSGNGQDTSTTNSLVTAGNTVTLISGGDTTLKGAVMAAHTVKADIGGNFSMASPQDSSRYTSQQSSAGGSISVSPAGVPVGGGVSASKSTIDSRFTSVNEQTAIRAGDGGFAVDVKGSADLKGAVITSTQAAVDANKNSFTTGGTLTLSDIQNSASYNANAAGLSVNVGAQDGKYGLSGVGAGVGSDKGNASSTTTAGISGIAGNTAVRTGDAQTGIKPILDAAKVQKEIDAQVAITQAFGKEASKAVGDYAGARQKEAIALRTQAQSEPDNDRATQLNAQAKALEDNWGERGTLRLASHTLIGGLTGGVGGAAGAAAGTLTAPTVAQALANAGISGPLASTLTAIASTAVGVAAGGTAGAGAALNEVANNYLKHADVEKLAKKLASCGPSDKACKDSVVKEAKTVSAKNDAELLACGMDQSCVQRNITEYVQGAQSFSLLYAADKTINNDSKTKTAFGAMSDMQTTGGLLAANLSAGNANAVKWQANNCVALTSAACETKFQVAAQRGELLPIIGLPQDSFGGRVAGLTSFRSPHEYAHSGTVCDGGNANCTPSSTYNALLQYPGPGSLGSSLVNSGTVSGIQLGPFLLGNVTHLVDPTTQSVVNITMPNSHGLDPGWVVRQVGTQPNGITSVSSYGAGTGANPFNINVNGAMPVWGGNVNFGIKPAANLGGSPVNAVLCARFGDCK